MTRRPHRLTLTLLLVTIFTVGTVQSASAHLVADYPTPYGWKYTILSRVFKQAPTAWPDAYNARATAAMATWTNLPGSALSFSLGANASTDAWACGTAWDLLTTAPLPLGVLGAIDVCSTPNSTTRILMSSNVAYYTGASTPNPPNNPDLQASVTHELGHAHQAWGHCTDGTPGDVDPCQGNHYDSTFNAAICNASTPAQYSTMCTPALSGSNSWRRRSLETHDIDLVENMY